MGLWKTVRREVVGAWRSARYDVDRHVGHHRAVRLQRAETAEIVVREIVWQRRPSPGRHHRSPEMPWAGRRPAPQKAEPAKPVAPIKQRRRAVATTGVALLVAGGAAGTYLAVAGSLVGVNHDRQDPPLAAPKDPKAPKESPVSSHTTTSPTQRSHRAAAPAPIKPADIRPVVPPAPAPAPSKSIEATPTPSATTSATPTPSPSVSATTTDDASAQITGRHRGRHHGQTGDGR